MTEKPVSRREAVAARIRETMARMPLLAAPEGVQPLNPGYFQLERIRTEAHAKDKAKQRPRLRSGTR